DAVAAVVPLVRPGETAPWGIVVAYGVIIPEPARKMREVTRSFEEYHQLAALKTPVKRSYLLSFLAIALLILFSATWFGYYLARGITGPVHRLAEATRAVAQGDLGHRIDLRPDDEFGILVDAFNRMTEDLQEGSRKLGEANQSLRDSNLELERKRDYVETVLENVTTGVISLDQRGGITTINRAAEGILGLTREAMMGRNFQEIFHHVPVEVGRRIIKKIRAGQGALAAEEVEFQLRNRIVHLRINLATLRDEQQRLLGTVIAFDDVSELIKAQRLAAWREVAQQLAHEIKNPLTPIPLCTHRLRKKHYEQVPDYDKIFDECTQTIIREVHSLKNLLQEFSTFARMPAPRLAPIALPEALGEVIRLYRGAHREIEILETLDPNLPMVQADREQIKRMLINLFENAVEAMGGRGRLWIQTVHDEGTGRAILEVADEGTGISPEDRSRLFIPYFSRKKTGTGLGLAIVHRIVTDHHGVIRVEDRPPRGTRFIIEFPTGDAAV
ncbi:MAG: HAMP domain-containing protein, partial [Nitrospirae bacterium]|nr:HAMP domain-containing protein [Nitrospirota bacterium]